MGNSPNPRPLPQLKLQETEVDQKDPWADDLLGRRELAAKLTVLVRNQTVPLRISLHGAWGTGKTFLLQRWAQDLRNEGFRAVYFNAWEEDSRQDPLVPILGRIQSELGPQFPEIIKGTGKLLGRFLVQAGSLVIETQTELPVGGVLSQAWTVIRRLRGTRNDPTDRHSHLKDTEKRLKESLEQLGSEVASSTNQPLVVIIDELDRCRPTYAVECLERIKHLLEIPNIVFVLGVNRDELCQSIKHVNGQIDASTYLQRFFDLEFNLPLVRTREFWVARVKAHGVRAFYGNPSVDDDHERLLYRNFEVNLFSRFGMLLEGMGLSLRETEHCVRIIAVAVRLINWEEQPDLKLLGMLALLKVKNPALFRDFAEGIRPNKMVVTYVQNTLIENGHPVADDLRRELLEIEVHLAEANSVNDPNAARQLVQLCNIGPDPERMEALSERLKETEKRELEAIRRNIESSRNAITGRPLYTQSIDRLISAIELAGGSADSKYAYRS